MNSRITLIRGDITRLEVDAVVNAANSTLLGGGGVDGAIHRSAGPQLLDACRKLNGCPTGESRITPGFNLPADYVIHTVGPVWHGGNHHEPELLASCYISSLQLALEYGIKTIAFPNISTGIYRYPKAEAAIIAMQEVTRFLANHQRPEKVIFAIFDEENLEIYREMLPT